VYERVDPLPASQKNATRNAIKDQTYNFPIKFGNGIHVKPNPLSKSLLRATSNTGEDSLIGVHFHEHESPKQMFWVNTIGPKIINMTFKAEKIPSDSNFSWPCMEKGNKIPTATC
jgi:hypothetical protein